MSTEYQEDKKPLNAVQYAAKDYPTYFDSILARLRENYGDDYDDFASTSVGIMLVNLMAYGLSQLSWYLDRRSSESYLATARTLDSVTRLASQIGYKPKRASAASADLKITFPALEADAIMSRGFKFGGPGGLTYQVMTDVSLAVGQTEATITVSEGEQRTQTFTSSGAPSQLFLIPGVLEGEYVADQSVRVYVNGLEWMENDFITYERTNQFAVSYTTSPPRVVFGDGSAGNIPDQGADIRIDYRVINAEAGNVRSNTITKAIDQLIVAGDFVSITSVTNPSPASGGSGPQSLSEIKKIAPLSFQAGGSAVTQQDYYAIVNSFSDPVYGSIAKGYAAVTRSVSLDTLTTDTLASMVTKSNTTRLALSAASSSIDQDRFLIDQYKTSVVSDLTTINSNLLALVASANQAKILADQAKNYALSASGSTSDIASTIRELRTAVADSDATQDQKIAMSILINKIDALALSAKTSADSAGSVSDASITSIDDVSSEATSSIAVTSRALISARSMSNPLASIAITKNTVAQIGVNNDTDVTSLVDTLRNHLDGLFDDSCKANVVTVPILVEGRDGFYGAPSSGLIRALQAKLDEVKEVTHLVKVVSGASALKPADISIRIRYDERYVVPEVRAEINSGIDALLRRRDFGKSLYISDLYAITEMINGISYVNITIDSPVDRIDVNGNLIVGELEVVTKGTIRFVEV